MASMDVDAAVEEKKGESVVEPEVDPLREALASADDVAATSAVKAEAAFVALVNDERTDDVAVKVREEAVYRLAKLFVTGRQFDKVMSLLESANPLFVAIPKAKTAKIVRTVIEIVSEVTDATAM